MIKQQMALLERAPLFQGLSRAHLRRLASASAFRRARAGTELVKEDVARLLDGTFLAGCPIAPVSVKTGQGLLELRQTLARLAAEVPERPTDQTARLPIDRVFTVKGFGTVVTGTLMAGRLAVDDRELVQLDQLGGEHVLRRGAAGAV